MQINYRTGEEVHLGDSVIYHMGGLPFEARVIFTKAKGPIEEKYDWMKEQKEIEGIMIQWKNHDVASEILTLNDPDSIADYMDVDPLDEDLVFKERMA